MSFVPLTICMVSCSTTFWVVPSHSGECEIQRFSKNTQMRAGRQGFTRPGISWVLHQHEKMPVMYQRLRALVLFLIFIQGIQYNFILTKKKSLPGLGVKHSLHGTTLIILKARTLFSSCNGDEPSCSSQAAPEWPVCPLFRGLSPSPLAPECATNLAPSALFAVLFYHNLRPCQGQKHWKRVCIYKPSFGIRNLACRLWETTAEVLASEV